MKKEEYDHNRICEILKKLIKIFKHSNPRRLVVLRLYALRYD